MNAQTSAKHSPSAHAASNDVADVGNPDRDTRSARVLTIIGIFKLLKAATLLAVGFGALHLMHHDLAEFVHHAARAMRVDPDDRLIQAALRAVAGVHDGQIEALAIGTFLFAALFFTEGIGLLLHKRWAEYFTAISTALLMPLEVYELIRRPTILRALILLVNAAVVMYLIVQLRKRPHESDSPS